MSPWKVETDPECLRRLGKLGEELGELQAVVSRCIIQGIDEIDPSSQKKNRLRLLEEIADAVAQIELTITLYNLNKEQITDRIFNKKADMYEWEDLVNEN